VETTSFAEKVWEPKVVVISSHDRDPFLCGPLEDGRWKAIHDGHDRCIVTNGTEMIPLDPPPARVKGKPIHALALSFHTDQLTIHQFVFVPFFESSFELHSPHLSLSDRRPPSAAHPHRTQQIVVFRQL